MSVLETPRILFRGNISWDPIVTNNYQPLYDENLGQTQLTGPPTREGVETFRSEAIEDVMPGLNAPRGPGGNWNPHGTHRSGFYDLPGPDPSCPKSALIASAVSGIDLGDGLDAKDAFVGAPARFTGMLVDVEPYGSQSSQLFFDNFSLGVEGGCRIFAKRRTRFTARYINFYRNPVFYTAGCASVIWQTSFRTEDLTIDTFDSAGLGALKDALGYPGVIGLTVRFVAYRTAYYDSPELATDKPARTSKAKALIAKLKAGGFQPNPARSKFVGVIGLWREGEPLHEPGDRPLLTQVIAGPPGTPTLGTAFARLGEDHITLDLSNSTPETGLDLAKKDWGALELSYLDGGGNPQPLGTIASGAYAQAAYEAGSGIVTLPLTADQVKAAATANLQISVGGTAYLLEEPVRAVPVIPNIYAAQGDEVSVAFQMYERGVPGRGGTEFQVFPVDFNGNIIGDAYNVTPDANGLAEVKIDATQGEVVGYVPVVDPAIDPTTIVPLATPYVYVRTIPSNDWMDSVPPTWDNVYASVLSNWNALAPCMDNWLQLDQPGQVHAFGKVLKTLTDPQNFESFRYMPVTRDMSPGERRLLYRFLDGPSPDAPPRVALTAFEARPEAKAETPVAPHRKTTQVWTPRD